MEGGKGIVGRPFAMSKKNPRKNPYKYEYG